MNKVWLFGETSEFSQSILTQLKKKSNDIQTFGRRNISYDDPIIEQINLSNLPDKIIINVNLDWELIGTRYSDRWAKPLTIINSISELLKYCYIETTKNITVVYVTSSVTIQQQNEKDFITWKNYISIRHTQQAMWSAYDSKKLKVLAVSPSKIDNNNREKYAERLVEFAYNPPMDRKSLIDLSWNGGFKNDGYHKDEWRSLYKIDK